MYRYVDICIYASIYRYGYVNLSIYLSIYLSIFSHIDRGLARTLTRDGHDLGVQRIEGRSGPAQLGPLALRLEHDANLVSKNLFALARAL